mgnify:CR=1 FL=1
MKIQRPETPYDPGFFTDDVSKYHRKVYSTPEMGRGYRKDRTNGGIRTEPAAAAGGLKALYMGRPLNQGSYRSHTVARFLLANR